MSVFIQLQPTYKSTGSLHLPKMTDIVKGIQKKESHTCFIKPKCMYTVQGSIKCSRDIASNMIRK